MTENKYKVSGPDGYSLKADYIIINGTRNLNYVLGKTDTVWGEMYST